MPEQPKPPKKNLLVQVARWSEIGVLLPACTVAGWLLGTLLDRWLHTTWLYLAGLILGIVAGFVQLIRMVTREKD